MGKLSITQKWCIPPVRVVEKYVNTGAMSAVEQVFALCSPNPAQSLDQSAIILPCAGATDCRGIGGHFGLGLQPVVHKQC
jgi:hypothetical protein